MNAICSTESVCGTATPWWMSEPISGSSLLFVMSRCKDPTIYAFEPAPVAYEILRANGEAYGGNILTVNAGVSDRARPRR